MTTAPTESYANYILSALQGGKWCTPEKHQATRELLTELSPAVVLELGSFGGGWILPTARAFPETKFYGVDPYSAGAAVEGMTNAESIQWWGREQMLAGVKESFLFALRELALTNVELLQMTSEQAVGRFEDGSLDCIHSDANHSEIPTLRDAHLWLPKLRVGGLFIQDDLGWVEGDVQTVRPAVLWLLKNGCEWMKEAGGAGFMRKVR